MAELTCPPLGTGSVDMNVLSDAARKAKSADDLAAALVKATAVVAPPADPEAIPTPAASATD